LYTATGTHGIEQLSLGTAISAATATGLFRSITAGLALLGLCESPFLIKRLLLLGKQKRCAASGTSDLFIHNPDATLFINKND
jgi:hypothetical protein